MAGRLALRPEILGRLDDPRAEDLEPEAVDGHPGGQGVIGGDQPLGQAQAVDRRARRQRRQERGHGPADLLASLVVFAPLEQERRLGLAGLLAKDQGRRDLLVELLSRLLGLLELRSQRLDDRTGLGIGVLDEVGAELLGLGFGPLGSLERDDRLHVRRASPAPPPTRCGPNPGREGIVKLPVLRGLVSMPALSQ